MFHGIRQLLTELTAAQEDALLDVSDYLELTGNEDEEDSAEMSAEVGPKEVHEEPRAFPITVLNESSAPRAFPITVLNEISAASTSGSTAEPAVWGGPRALPFTIITETLTNARTDATDEVETDSPPRVANKGKGKYVSPSGTVYATKVLIANEIISYSKRTSGK